ncbi:RHS repeat-associated core domain-containing protein [Candidatus Amarolinea aalborgensis]|uniref:RHS repeat-associated core domain-containing protein n=1 Tax=Candidatus Amarolinea aalborgensis TaxID=2249329 RepID=UPI003BF9DD89
MARWLATDHLGSTAVTANEVGARIAELRYKPWGESRYSFGATPTQRRFTGQVLDSVGGGLYFYNARYYDPALGRFASADTIVPQPGNPQSLNRYSYALNNAVRYADPSGHYSDDEIQQYLKDMYHQNWESYWKAWLTDPYWIWVLHMAQDGYLLHTDQGGNVTFNHRVGSFTLDHGELHEYQGKGVYALFDNHMNLVKDGEWLHYGSQAGTLGLILQNPETVYYQPLYDYSNGSPIFRAWQKIQAQWSSQFVWTFGSGEPWLLMAAGQILSQWGPTAAAGSFVTGVGSGWGIVTLIDAVTVNIADDVSYSMITDWPPRAAVCSPPQAIPAYYQWPNPNGVAYPAPRR